MAYSTEDIRNVALVGHAGAGKTLLSEALLQRAGVIDSMGELARGTTASDFDPLEREHGHSLNSSVLACDRNGCRINLIDTPGYPDFAGAAVGVLPAVETVAVVVNAQRGIETMTRRLLEWTGERRPCRMIIINQIDAQGVDLPGLLAAIQEAYGSECLPINLPAEGATRVVDCFFNPEGDADFSSVEAAHTALVDQVVEVDEALMEEYLEQGEIEPARLHDPLERALREGHLIPVCFASAATGAGVPELLEVFEHLLPNPAEGNPPRFVNGDDGSEITEVAPDSAAHAVAHVFKVTFDNFVGRTAMFRVHQGTIGKDSQLYVDDNRKPFKVGHLLRPHGRQHVEIERAVPGDICAVTKVDGIRFGSVLHDSHDEDGMRLPAFPMPAPMVGLAISPRARGEEQKVGDALMKIAEEDPCLVVDRDSGTNELVLRGMGDLHLRIALERMQRQYGVEVDTRPPSIPYRETITRNAEGHYRHKKQTGGAGQFGEVFLRVEPLERGAGFEFANAVVGGAIPSQFIPAVEKGVRQVLEGGAFAGFPMQDVRVTVHDGKHHPVDSKEVAFVTAGRKAFIDAVLKAGPVVLEPIMTMEVSAPSGAMGDLTGDLSSRRGRVNSTDALSGGTVVIHGQAPLAEMSDYQSRLNSITAGEGSYTLAFSHYEAVPGNVQQQLMAGFSHAEDE